jgi:hypothetical protein
MPPWRISVYFNSSVANRLRFPEQRNVAHCPTRRVEGGTKGLRGSPRHSLKRVVLGSVAQCPTRRAEGGTKGLRGSPRHSLKMELLRSGAQCPTARGVYGGIEGFPLRKSPRHSLKMVLGSAAQYPTRRVEGVTKGLLGSPRHSLKRVVLGSVAQCQTASGVWGGIKGRKSPRHSLKRVVHPKFPASTAYVPT